MARYYGLRAGCLRRPCKHVQRALKRHLRRFDGLFQPLLPGKRMDIAQSQCGLIFFGLKKASVGHIAVELRL
jgi:hypothetical protein